MVGLLPIEVLIEASELKKLIAVEKLLEQDSAIHIEVKFRLDFALDHDGKRPPRTVLTQVLKEGLPDYLDFLKNLKTHPLLRDVPLIYGSSNEVMSMAAGKHCGFNVNRIKDPERDKMLEEDPDWPIATHVLYASPEELIAKTDHIRGLIQRTTRW